MCDLIKGEDKFTIFLDFLIQVVDVDSMIEPHVGSSHRLTCK